MDAGKGGGPPQKVVRRRPSAAERSAARIRAAEEKAREEREAAEAAEAAAAAAVSHNNRSIGYGPMVGGVGGIVAHSLSVDGDVGGGRGGMVVAPCNLSGVLDSSSIGDLLPDFDQGLVDLGVAGVGGVEVKYAYKSGGGIRGGRRGIAVGGDINSGRDRDVVHAGLLTDDLGYGLAEAHSLSSGPHSNPAAGGVGVGGADDALLRDGADGAGSAATDDDVGQALMKQIEMQTQLHEQLMAQRKLQQAIEAHGKYLESIMEQQRVRLGDHPMHMQPP